MNRSKIENVPQLPTSQEQEEEFANEIETREVLKLLTEPARKLAELKATAQRAPNFKLIYEAIQLREAESSSEIENIQTTQEELYKARIFESMNPQLKEVENYVAAIEFGSKEAQRKGGISTNLLVDIHSRMDISAPGLRGPGTVISGGRGTVVWRPPQQKESVLQLMSNLEAFMNQQSVLDPLVKMAIVHHQFESIHPFHDGNGRIGRILSTLFLQKEELLHEPALYLSGPITRRKSDYYDALQTPRENDWNYHSYLAYMLQMVSEAAVSSMNLINAILGLMSFARERLIPVTKKSEVDTIVTSLFRHPYIKPIQLQNVLGVGRGAATRRLRECVSAGVLSEKKVGKELVFENGPLFEVLRLDPKRDVSFDSNPYISPLS